MIHKEAQTRARKWNIIIGRFCQKGTYPRLNVHTRCYMGQSSSPRCTMDLKKKSCKFTPRGTWATPSLHRHSDQRDRTGTGMIAVQRTNDALQPSPSYPFQTTLS